MTNRVDLDRRLSAWLEEEAAPRAPGELQAQFITDMQRTRQRPSWATTERWISMETRARFGAVPRTAIILVVIGLLMALAAGAIVAGSAGEARAANGRIAFQHMGDIYTAQPDGSDRRVLVDGPGLQTGPSWSPDGTHLAYWSAASANGPWQLTVVEADGSNPVAVAADVLEVTGWQTTDWSPDSSSLAFSARTVRGGLEPCIGSSSVLGDFCSSRIFVTAADGSTGAVQVGDPDLDARTAADGSTDGSTIAFSGGDAGEGIGLYLMAPDGEDVRRIDQVSGTGWTFIRLDWSPDGDSIVATAGVERWDVYVFAADGSGEVRVSDVITERTVDQFFPTYGPDGTLAWHGGVPSADGLVLLEAGDVPVAHEGFGGASGFSPDGLLIATSSDAAPGDIYIVDREGTVVTVIDVTPNGEFGAVPSWQRLPM